MTKCNYTDDCIGLFDCEEPALPGYDKCILHIPFPNDKSSFLRVLNLKYDRINEKIRNNDFDFTGTIMLGLNINKTEIDENLIFDWAEIHGDLEFKNDYIKGRSSFMGVNVDGNVNFEGSIIQNELNFMSGTVTKGSVFFNDTIISGKVYFDAANLEGYLDFKSSIIHNEANFRLKKIGYDAEFNEITIDRSANFNGIEVGGYISLEYAEIGGNIDFEESKLGTSKNSPDGNDSFFIGANIKGEADFMGAEFFGEANFSKTSFRENTYFFKTTFNKNVDFLETRFYENVDFVETNFKKQANFNNASFLNRGLFRGLKDPLKFYSSFEEARLKNVAFRDCDLTCVRFKHVILENCELSTSNWNNKILEHKKYEKNKGLKRNFESIKSATFREKPTGTKENFKRYLTFIKRLLKELWSPSSFKYAKIAGDTYRRIRQSLQQQGAYDQAGTFYVKEMDMKREVYLEENKGLWFVYTILSLTTGYGEKLVNITIIFVIYWSIYIYAVYSMPDNNLVIPVGSGFLSIVTALFVYVFARKMAR